LLLFAAAAAAAASGYFCWAYLLINPRARTWDDHYHIGQLRSSVIAQ